MTHLGDFGPGGAPAAVDDMAILSRRARAENPGLPLVLMGHSMGAMFAQAYILDHSALIDALVLSGTAGPGPRMKGGPNSVYANPRTAYDWLSRDAARSRPLHRRPLLRHPVHPGQRRQLRGPSRTRGHPGSPRRRQIRPADLRLRRRRGHGCRRHEHMSELPRAERNRQVIIRQSGIEQHPAVDSRRSAGRSRCGGDGARQAA